MNLNSDPGLSVTAQYYRIHKVTVIVTTKFLNFKFINYFSELHARDGFL